MFKFCRYIIQGYSELFENIMYNQKGINFGVEPICKEERVK